MNCNWQHLCHATIHAVIHRNLRMKKVCAHWVPRDLILCQKKKSGCGRGNKVCRTARSCLLFTRTKKDSLPDWLLVMDPGFTVKFRGEKAIHGEETWWQSLSKEISDSTFCWKTEYLSNLEHEGHPVTRGASPRANNQQWDVLQYPYMSLLQNPTRKLKSMGIPGSDLHDNVRPHKSKQTT